MIVDAHVHFMEREHMPEPWWQNITVREMRNLARPGESLGLARARERLADLLADPKGEKLIRAMDEAGVDKAVILPMDYYLTLGKSAATIEEVNEFYAKMAAAHSDRLIAFVGVDPRRGKEATELFDRGVEKWGMRGLKIHPVVGFYMNDERAYPLYERCQKLGLPVLFHTGAARALPMKSRFGQPIYIDDVAVHFPDLNLIAAHMGGHGWWQEALMMASWRPNVYLDISAWQRELVLWPLEFYRILRMIMDSTARDRVLFGSDWPVLKTILSEKDWVSSLREPEEAVAKAGFTFTKEESEALLGGNAARLLGLR